MTTLYSMFKLAGEGWSEGLVSIMLVEEHHHDLVIVVKDTVGLCFTRVEPNTRVGYLFDQFMHFASLESISVDVVKAAGLIEKSIHKG